MDFTLKRTHFCVCVVNIELLPGRLALCSTCRGADRWIYFRFIQRQTVSIIFSLQTWDWYQSPYLTLNKKPNEHRVSPKMLNYYFKKNPICKFEDIPSKKQLGFHQKHLHKISQSCIKCGTAALRILRLRWVKHLWYLPVQLRVGIMTPPSIKGWEATHCCHIICKFSSDAFITCHEKGYM